MKSLPIKIANYVARSDIGISVLVTVFFEVQVFIHIHPAKTIGVKLRDMEMIYGIIPALKC